MTSPPPGPPPPADPSSPSSAPLAGFGLRLKAFVIDWLVLGAAGFGFVLPIYLCLALALIDPVTTVDGQQVAGQLTPGSVLTMIGILALIAVLSLLLGYVYHVELPLRGDGQTLGKRIAGVQMAPLDPAATLSRRQLAARFLAQVALGVLGPLFWLDGLFQLWDQPYRQCLHDKVAKTVVVRLSR